MCHYKVHVLHYACCGEEKEQDPVKVKCGKVPQSSTTGYCPESTMEDVVTFQAVYQPCKTCATKAYKDDIPDYLNMGR